MISSNVLFRTRLALAAVGLALSAGAFAADTSAAPSAAPAATVAAASAGPASYALPSAMAGLVKHGGQVLKSFPAIGGLTGWVYQPKEGKPLVLFTTADGQALIQGEVIDLNGRGLTEGYADKYVPKPDYQALGLKLEKAAAVTAGATGAAVKSTLYIFADPNCVYCNMLYREVQPYEKVGLQVKWVMVGFLRDDSVGKAAAILQAPNQLEALDLHGHTVNALKETGGITPVMPKPETTAILKADEALMKQFGFNGTPGVVYQDAEGKFRALNGFPVPEQLASIVRLPEQKQTDAELLKFVAGMRR